jgi:hypothetical protein
MGPAGPVGPAGPAGAPGVDSNSGQAVTTLANVSMIITLEGWTAIGPATEAPQADGSVLISCSGGADYGVCGYSHPLDVQGISKTVSLQPAFAPTWGSVMFGLRNSGTGELLVILHDVNQGVWDASCGLVTWGSSSKPVTVVNPTHLPETSHPWFRVEETNGATTFSYSAEGIVWYPIDLGPIVTQANMWDQYFLGTYNGAASTKTAFFLRHEGQ